MKIDVYIKYQSKGTSGGSAEFLKGEVCHICDFEVRQEGGCIVVNFLHESERSEPSEAELAVMPRIVREYMRLSRLADKENAKHSSIERPSADEKTTQCLC